MRRIIWSCLALLCLAAACFAQVDRTPHLAYVYPAGGQTGATCRVLLGGEFLQKPTGVVFTGPNGAEAGVDAKIVEWVKPIGKNVLGDVRRAIAARLNPQQATRKAAAAKPQTPAGQPNQTAAPAPTNEPPALPDHPWLRSLDRYSRAELEQLRDRLIDPRIVANPALAEWVLLDVTIAPNAPLGDWDLRLLTANGLSQPMRFQVGPLPEHSYVAAGDFHDHVDETISLPALLNGQVLPGARHTWKIRAKAGQQLVVACDARALIPYRADAVPGWFQPAISLYDPSKGEMVAGELTQHPVVGQELAFADHWRADQDPVLTFTVPADGVYGLEIHDTIYRGREDFVYRLAIGALPLITSAFPLGGQVGQPTTAALTGVNLPAPSLPLDTTPGASLRTAALTPANWQPRPLRYAVDDLPELIEKEPNDTPAKPQSVAWNVTVNGRIDRPGDVDVYAITAQAGDELVAETTARRLGSPIDTLLTLRDPAGAIVAQNDDFADATCGRLTHQADSHLQFKLKTASVYTITVADVQGHGGPEFAYRLRLGRPRPDFALVVTPASLSLRPGATHALTVHAARRDGFTGAINLKLANNTAGFVLSGARVPEGCDEITVTVTAPLAANPQRPRARAAALVDVQLDGAAAIAGQPTTRHATAADPQMQAFAYWHNVPALRQLVRFAGQPGANVGAQPPSTIVDIAAAGETTIRYRLTRPLDPATLSLALVNAPKGMSVSKVEVTEPFNAAKRTGELAITIKTAADGPKVGYCGNLVFEATKEPQAPDAAGRKKKPVKQSPGLLPAVMYRAAE